MNIYVYAYALLVVFAQTSSCNCSFTQPTNAHLVNKSYFFLMFCWPCVLVWPTWCTITLSVYYYNPLHVSNNFVLIIRRSNRINTTSGIAFSQVTVRCACWEGMRVPSQHSPVLIKFSCFLLFPVVSVVFVQRIFWYFKTWIFPNVLCFFRLVIIFWSGFSFFSTARRSYRTPHAVYAGRVPCALCLVTLI